MTQTLELANESSSVRTPLSGGAEGSWAHLLVGGVELEDVESHDQNGVADGDCGPPCSEAAEPLRQPSVRWKGRWRAWLTMKPRRAARPLGGSVPSFERTTRRGSSLTMMEA